jgi:hypothetical protein
LFAVDPVCEECASSAMMAKFRPFRAWDSAMAFSAKGKVWMVTMMIGVRATSAAVSSADLEPALPRMGTTTPDLCSIW